jgi:RHH-type transcriptional regulator, proline utilization regulon repressor / proline dehydrogenase / delta 1-pyrroline-5-carboxylate dehydrogenase
VGAVVGVQPFGGEGKSGTGPKAGGPLYLKRLQWNVAASLDNQAGKAAGQGEYAHHPLPQSRGMDALLLWAREHGHAAGAALGEHYVKTTLSGTRLVLPGPTGERNTLAFAPRGPILCAASTTGGLINQLLAVLASGNRAVIPQPSTALLPNDLPGVVSDMIERVDLATQPDLELHLALLDTSCAAILRTTLAARDGALVPVIETNEYDQIAQWRLVAERALCVNTTAAGGNASLMMLGG